MAEEKEKPKRNRKKANPDYSTRFGGSRANPRGDQSTANGIRYFMAKAEEWNEEQLTEYFNNPENPFAYRKVCQHLLNLSFKDFCKYLNQAHGKPKETLSVENLPSIDIVSVKTITKDYDD